jgi:hypothetical protein
VDVELEVTVIFTKLTTATGVPVMEKSLDAVVVLFDVEKKLVELPSGAAVTAIVTPLAGIAEVTLTFRLKGPSAGACVELTAGVVVTARVASGVFLLPPPHAERNDKKAKARAITSTFFLADRCFIKDELEFQNNTIL